MLLGQSLLPSPSGSSPAAGLDVASAGTVAAGAASMAVSSEPPGFARHRLDENRALREQCQALRMLLEVKEEQSRHAYGHLQASNREGEQLWLHIMLLQEQLERCYSGLEPSQPFTTAGSSALQPLQATPPATPVAAPIGAPSGEELAGFELGTESPNSRHVLSLLSMTPAPSMGTYVGTPFLPPMEAPLMSPPPTGSAQASLLPSPSGRPMPSPPQHAAPVSGLLSPEKMSTLPPDRDASDDTEEPRFEVPPFPPGIEA